MMLLSKCGLSIEALGLAAGLAMASGASAAPIFVGGGDGPSYTTQPTVSLLAHSGEAGSREVIHTIDGSGMLSKVTDDRQPVSTMALFRNIPDGLGNYNIPPNPTGLAGSSNWAYYDLGSVVPLQKVWIWNWNERADTTPDNTAYGWQFAAIQHSVDGTTWSAPLNVVIPQSDASTGSAVDLVTFIGEQARYVVLANQGVGPTLTYQGDDGLNDAGLSEVRFEVPEPASLSLLSFAAIALVRRRK